MENTFSSFPNKDNRALEFTSAGSDYVIFRPDVSFDLNGNRWHLSTMIEHQRGNPDWIQKDDTANVEMTFYSRTGNLSSVKIYVEMADKTIDTGWISAAGAATGDAEIAAATTAISSALNQILSFINGLGERGGRANFPYVIQNKINEMQLAVKSATNHYFGSSAAGPITVTTRPRNNSSSGSAAVNEYLAWARTQSSEAILSNLLDKARGVLDSASTTEQAANRFAVLSDNIAQYVGDPRAFDGDVGATSRGTQPHHDWALRTGPGIARQNLMWKIESAFKWLNRGMQEQFYSSMSIIIRELSSQ